MSKNAGTQHQSQIEAVIRPTYLIVVSSATQMYSGVGRVLFDWIRFAAPHFQFSMLMDIENYENFCIGAAFCRENDIPLHASRTARRPGAPDTGMGGAARILGSKPWDFVEIVSWASAATALDVLAALPKSAHLVFTPHTQPVETLSHAGTQFLVGPVFEAVIRAASLICCVSPAERAQLAARYAGPNRFCDTPNGVDAEFFRPSDTPRDVTVLSVFDAREHRKRSDLMWSAFRVAATLNPHLRLIVVGRGTRDLPIPDDLRSRVATLGYVTEDVLLNAYRTARCLVLLSDFEAFGLPVAEALMCGTPIVATAGAQQRSLFAGLPGVTLVDNHDAEASGAAIHCAAAGSDWITIALAARARFGLEVGYGRKLAALRSLPPSPALPGPRQEAPRSPQPYSPAKKRSTGRASWGNKAKPPSRVLQVSPAYFSDDSYVGGGERYVENVCKAVRVAATSGLQIECSAVSFGPVGTRLKSNSGIVYDIVAGRPDAPDSIDGAALDRLLDAADVVHVHQCFTAAGMFVASHARLLGKRVLGSDHGGGEIPQMHSHPRLVGVYDAVVAFSRFGETAFLDFDIPVHRIFGPVDDAYFSADASATRDRRLLIAVGRVLPHKGLHRIIDALPPSLSLVIAGRSYDAAYRAYIEDRARGKDIRFAEALDDAGILRLMRRAGLGIHVSTHIGPNGAFFYKPELLGLAPLECLCTGLPMIVSGAGALRELGELPGCQMVETDVDLRSALERWASGTEAVPHAATISYAARARYGLRQFGAAYLGLLDGTVR